MLELIATQPPQKQKLKQLTVDDLPDHTQLPDSDGTFVKNFQEHPQSILLTDSLTPIFQQHHPDGNYCIGQDCGIYWLLTRPRHNGAEAPDWFYVPHVPPALDGKMRRSYVLWKEKVPPLIVLEFVSGDGRAERDRTPLEGKFWVYENVIQPKYYGIYTVERAEVVVYELVNGQYQPMTTNQRQHYVIPEIEIELGIWQGRYQNVELPWLRAWDAVGNLLLTGDERAEQAFEQIAAEHQRAEDALRQAAQEEQRAEDALRQVAQEEKRTEDALKRAKRLAAKLSELGLNPDEV